jgi:hypothetical protein
MHKLSLRFTRTCIIYIYITKKEIVKNNLQKKEEEEKKKLE